MMHGRVHTATYQYGSIVQHLLLVSSRLRVDELHITLRWHQLHKFVSGSNAVGRRKARQVGRRDGRPRHGQQMVVQRVSWLHVHQTACEVVWGECGAVADGLADVERAVLVLGAQLRVGGKQGIGIAANAGSQCYQRFSWLCTCGCRGGAGGEGLVVRREGDRQCCGASQSLQGQQRVGLRRRRERLLSTLDSPTVCMSAMAMP